MNFTHNCPHEFLVEHQTSEGSDSAQFMIVKSPLKSLESQALLLLVSLFLLIIFVPSFSGLRWNQLMSVRLFINSGTINQNTNVFERDAESLRSHGSVSRCEGCCQRLVGRRGTAARRRGSGTASSKEKYSNRAGNKERNAHNQRPNGNIIYMFAICMIHARHSQ